MLQLDEGKNIYRPIVENMSEGVVFIDADDTIVICNKAAERIRTVRADKIIGKKIYTIHPKKMHERITQLLRSLRSGETDWATRNIVVKRRHIANSYSAIRAPDGAYLGTLLLSHDVTEEQRLRRENENLRKGASPGVRCCVVARSSAAQKISEMTRALAAVDSTVLVTGESGVGKECVVDMLHRESSRSTAPLIKVNCAALPENLIESELFGYTKGAFTGATENRKGKFELADGGILFLDEIAEMPLMAQSKLLRVLQERVVHPLGGRSGVLVDVRIVAATNHVLADEVAAKRFREDLYYRLNVVNIEVPPLRERVDDIEPLANTFLQRFSEKMQRPLRFLSDEALQLLLQYHWPGNVRQLEHAMERAVALSSGELILVDDLPEEIRNIKRKTSPHSCGKNHPEESLKEAVEQFEAEFIAAALRRHQNRKGQTAQTLGISRKSLWQKIQKHDLVVDA
ncbi:MAG: sigma 54-interacting transcriptional regulator [Desulfuromonadaceae bacterium]|nr:sigma 54-interacting transcriptional regulator [Desulfuromonadaceae bacterium]